ncbi:Phosphatidylethanolamine-binding protein 4 [Anas platyrhynchos]|uniref:Phosphatidylethanolamine-binding protein 4 n=1 Tax=Anas platyrhynchos TaxID=8839 RepID=R0KYT3_ANAPL|nr:Phosphatidylethanolamine-binding protein 4 [Anas platyrhynchos]
MELLGAVLLAASLLGTTAWGAQAPWPDEPSHTCFFQTLGSPDSEFCRGDLEVIYPQLGDVGCSYIPQCHQYRWRISREWGSPRVRYPRADKLWVQLCAPVHVLRLLLVRFGAPGVLGAFMRAKKRPPACPVSQENLLLAAPRLRLRLPSIISGTGRHPGELSMELRA